MRTPRNKRLGKIQEIDLKKIDGGDPGTQKRDGL